MIDRAVILAAGRGTRFLPYTKAYPKEMLAVADKPALQLLVEEVSASGIKNVLIVISRDKQDVVRHFTPDRELERSLEKEGKGDAAEQLRALDNLAEVSFAYQQTANGTGNALLLAEDWAENKPFAVLNGDDVILSDEPVTLQLARAYERCRSCVVGVQQVDRNAIRKYASCRVEESDGRLHRISDIVEKPRDNEVYSLLAPLGRYVALPQVFDVIRRTPKRGNEVCFTDALQIMAREQGIFAYEFQGERFDFGDKLGYVKGVTRYALADGRFHDEYLAYLKELIKNL